MENNKQLKPPEEDPGAVSGDEADPESKDLFRPSSAEKRLRKQQKRIVNVHQFYPILDDKIERRRQSTLVNVIMEPSSDEDSDEDDEDALTDVTGEGDSEGDGEVSDDKKESRTGRSDSIFSTAVGEKMLLDAKKRQREGSRIFKPEEWDPAKPAITAQEVIDTKANEHYHSAMESLVNGNHERCIMFLNKAITLKPKEVGYYVQRAETYLLMTDFQSAILNYTKACMLEGSDPAEESVYYSRLAFIYYFQGQCLFDQRLFPEALEAFSKAAEMKPGVVGYHTRSIACLAALNRHGECLALVNKRLESEHDNPDLYVMRARLHHMFRNFTLCYYDIKDALALQPDHPEAIKLKSVLEAMALDAKHHSLNLTIMNKPRDALQKISLAIEANPSVAEFHVLRGALHRRLGDFNSAVDDYLLAMDKTEHTEDSQVYKDAQRQLLLTYNDFSVECFKKGFYEEAIILLNKAIKGEKFQKGLYINRGDCFFRQNEVNFALADYHQALELDPGDQSVKTRISIIHNEHGVADYADKKYQDAETRFTLAIQHNPNIGQYYISRARARYMMENHHGARSDILMALHLDPNHDEVLSLISRLFPGKSISDIMSSKAATAAKHALQSLVTPSSPMRLPPLEPGEAPPKPSPDVDYATSVAGSLRPGGVFPDLQACMQEREFAIKIAKEKKKIGDKIKDALHERKSLRYTGGRVQTIAVSKPYKPSKEKLVKDNTKKDVTNWRNLNLTMGIGLKGDA